mmetsp:Transcript_24348/g.52540  ORF Transcript_24348/g.52540 Transcript_24348/m.52540 type:complete len:208 (+) Transcript_24348:901-1524(+)
MQGIVPAETVLLCSEKPVRLHHDERVGGLHREEKVVVVELPADVGKLDGRLDHAARRVAVEGEDARGERAVVGADAHGAVERLALFHERSEGVDEEVSLLEEVVVGLVDHLFERLAAVDKVARVDPDLLDRVGHDERDLGGEVHVGADWNVIPLLVERLADAMARLGVLHAHNGHADEVEALISATHDLVGRALDVGGEGRRHRLTD